MKGTVLSLHLCVRIVVHQSKKKNVHFYRREGKGKQSSKEQQSCTKRQYLTRVIVKVRDHFILEVAKQLKKNEFPNIFYHRQCRSFSSRCSAIWRL